MKTVFDLDACCLFRQHVLVVTTLIRVCKCTDARLMQVPRKVGAAVVFLCSDSVILQTPREVGAVVGIGS